MSKWSRFLVPELFVLDVLKKLGVVNKEEVKAEPRVVVDKTERITDSVAPSATTDSKEQQLTKAKSQVLSQVLAQDRAVQQLFAVFQKPWREDIAASALQATFVIGAPSGNGRGYLVRKTVKALHEEGLLPGAKVEVLNLAAFEAGEQDGFLVKLDELLSTSPQVVLFNHLELAAVEIVELLGRIIGARGGLSATLHSLMNSSRTPSACQQVYFGFLSSQSLEEMNATTGRAFVQQMDEVIVLAEYDEPAVVVISEQIMQEFQAHVRQELSCELHYTVDFRQECLRKYQEDKTFEPLHLFLYGQAYQELEFFLRRYEKKDAQAASLHYDAGTQQITVKPALTQEAADSK